VSARCAAILLATSVAWGLARAGEAEIRKSVESLYPTAKVSSVRKLDHKGMYEVTVGNEVIYADESGRYLYFGPLIDSQTKVNLTEERKNELGKIDFSQLPLDLAVKTVRGSGRRVFAAFEDPNCGYCKRLHEALKGMTDYTLYTFLTPILSEDSRRKTKGILCSDSPSGALRDWMESNVNPRPAPPECTADSKKVTELAQKLGVQGTPTLFFQNGSRAPGYMPQDQLETALNKASPLK
jgi:thiol:disulfide interchange protein DsbC